MSPIKLQRTVFVLAVVSACTFPTKQAQGGAITTISFTYSGTDTTGIGGFSFGSGNVAFIAGQQPVSDSLFELDFSQTTVVPVGSVSSTFTYQNEDVTKFSMTFDNNAAPFLTLITGPVAGSDPVFFPESFATDVGLAQTFNNSGNLLQSGTVTLDQSSVCSAILASAVTAASDGTMMTATFTPNFGLSLNSAEADCGVSNFNWQQTITSLPAPSPYYQNGQQTTAPPPFLDPVPGGWDTNPPASSCSQNPVVNGEDSNPFYWGSGGELAAAEVTGTSLTFSDDPTDPCLPAGQFIYFTTTLVGVDAHGNPVALPLVDSFNWRDNFNGTVGGGAEGLKTLLPADPGSGTGGAELLSSTPEPAAVVLFGAGLFSIGVMRRRRRTIESVHKENECVPSALCFSALPLCTVRAAATSSSAIGPSPVRPQNPPSRAANC